MHRRGRAKPALEIDAAGRLTRLTNSWSTGGVAGHLAINKDYVTDHAVLWSERRRASVMPL